MTVGFVGANDDSPAGETPLLPRILINQLDFSSRIGI